MYYLGVENIVPCFKVADISDFARIEDICRTMQCIFKYCIDPAARTRNGVCQTLHHIDNNGKDLYKVANRLNDLCKQQHLSSLSAPEPGQ